MKFFNRFRRRSLAAQGISYELQVYFECLGLQAQNERVAVCSRTASYDEVQEALRVVMTRNPVNCDELFEIAAEFQRVINGRALNHMLQIYETLRCEAWDTWRAHTEGVHLRFVYKPLLIKQYDDALALLKSTAEGDDPSMVATAYLAADAIRTRLLVFQTLESDEYSMVPRDRHPRWDIFFECGGLLSARLRTGAFDKNWASDVLADGNLH